MEANNKAMREALEAVREAFDSNDFGAMGDHPSSDVLDMADAVRRKVEAALAAPVRNCDRAKDEAEELFKERFGRPWTQTEDELAAFLFAPANDGQVGNAVETSANAATGSEDAGSPASEGGAE